MACESMVRWEGFLGPRPVYVEAGASNMFWGTYILEGMVQGSDIATTSKFSLFT